MKKIIIVIMLLIPLNVFAYTGPLDTDSFYVNNQTSSPFTFTIPSNGNTNVIFDLVWDWYHGSTSNLDLPGSYLFISVISDKKIDIQRRYAFNQYCNLSCFSTDDYLQLIDDTNGYSYVYYFNILKWARNIGTQVDIFSVSDYITFTNLESGQATVYLYGAYSDTTNQIPQYINNAETTQQIIIDGQTNTDLIINNQNDLLTSDCYNIFNSTSGSTTVSGLTITKNPDGSFTLNGTYSGSSTFFYRLANDFTLLAGTYTLSNSNSNVSYTKGAIFYDDNRNFDIINVSTKTFSSTVTIKPYIRISPGSTFNNFIIYPMIYKGSEIKNYCAYNSKINKIDESNDKLNDVDNSLNNLNDNIISKDIDNPNSDFSDMEDMIAHNGVITNLIALPITLYSSILNGLNQSCSEYNFGQLFGSDLKFQCINLGGLLGNTIWGVIDVLFSGFTIYAISKKMIKVFNNFSGLSEGDVIDD